MSKKKTGKEALLLWLQQRTADYAEVQITNFHTSWRDGMGFVAIFHYFKPG
jgi:spectrin beta